MKSPRRSMRAIGPCAILVGLAVQASAESTSLPGLGLARVVKATLSSSPELELASREIDSAEGALLIARGDFDLVLETGADVSAVAPAKGKPTERWDFSYGLRAQRLLRSGISIAPELSLARTRLWNPVAGKDDFTLSETNSAQARLGISVPLLRNRGGATNAALERAAERDLDATRLGRQHVAAERVLTAVAAYWDYLAACRNLEVLKASEERARRTVDQTRALVEADERTPADVVQVRGNLASKRVSRLSAEQVALEAKADLGLAMGLRASAALALEFPATDFPAPARSRAHLDTARLVEEAYRHRADLAAADVGLRSARIRTDAARSESRPRLDLGLNAGTAATGKSERWDGFFSSLDGEPTLDAIAQLTFEFPVENSAARGRLRQSAAVYEQSRIAHADLRRRIATGVALAAEAVARSEAAMVEAQEAVRLFESGVQAVQRKFQLGSSTLFDLIQAQDALTNAQLSHVQSQRDYAIAIATLRFQSGRLVEGRDGASSVPVADLTRPP